MKKSLIAAMLGVFAIGAHAKPEVANLEKDASAIHASFGTGQSGGEKYAFATNTGSEPRMLKTVIYKVGAFKDPKATGVTIKLEGKDYNMLETYPATKIGANTSVKKFVPHEAGEYAIRLTVSDEGMSKKGQAESALSSVFRFSVAEGGQPK